MSEPPLPAAVRARVLVPFALVTLIWGSTWLVIRHQLGVVPPEWSICWRFLIASAALFAGALVSGQGVRLPRGAHVVAFGIGLLQFTSNFQFVYHAEAHIASGLVALVFALLVVPNAILGRVFLGQQLSRPFLLGSAVALGGIGLLFAHELARDPATRTDTAIGIALTVLAVLAASCGNVLQATERARAIAALSLLAWATLYGSLANMVWAWTTVGPPQIEWTAAYVAGVLYLGLFGSALTFPLYLGVIRAIGPARAAYSSVLVPVLAMGLSTIFEDYRWSAAAAVGGALTLAGLVVALRSRARA